MSNIDIAKKLYAAFNAHDMEGILDLLTEDITWHSFSVDWALAIGYFEGHPGVRDFFAKLVGTPAAPNSGQQQDVLFEPLSYSEGAKGAVHVMGCEKGYFTDKVLDGSVEGQPFFNNFDHTLWFEGEKINHFRCNYTLARTAPTFWPPAGSVGHPTTDTY